MRFLLPVCLSILLFPAGAIAQQRSSCFGSQPQRLIERPTPDSAICHDEAGTEVSWDDRMSLYVYGRGVDRGPSAEVYFSGSQSGNFVYLTIHEYPEGSPARPQDLFSQETKNYTLTWHNGVASDEGDRALAEKYEYFIRQLAEAIAQQVEAR